MHCAATTIGSETAENAGLCPENTVKAVHSWTEWQFGGCPADVVPPGRHSPPEVRTTHFAPPLLPRIGSMTASVRRFVLTFSATAALCVAAAIPVAAQADPGKCSENQLSG